MSIRGVFFVGASMMGAFSIVACGTLEKPDLRSNGKKLDDYVAELRARKDVPPIQGCKLTSSLNNDYSNCEDFITSLAVQRYQARSLAFKP